MGVGDKLHEVDHCDHHDDSAVRGLLIGMEDGVGWPQEDNRQVQPDHEIGESFRPEAVLLNPLAEQSWGQILLARCHDSLRPVPHYERWKYCQSTSKVYA